MNLSAIIPLWLLLKDSGVLSPARRVPFQPITLPPLTSEEAAEAYIAGVAEHSEGGIMTMSKWLKRNPGKTAADYYKYVTAFS
tara:strand:+ start:256 stop:504 length:249 start_codon:yes stop_codon:yes gene_type:complete